MQKKKLKKIIAISGVVGTILTIKSIPANATELNSGVSVASISKGEVVNVTSTLRIREEASTNSSVLGTIRNGSTFDIISKSGGWYQIKYNGITGYVHGDYVKEVTASSSVLTKGKVYNVSTNLRVRSGASTNSLILGYITNNTEVSIVGTEGSWYKIQYNGGYGYVSKEYITVNGSSSNNGGSSNNNSSSETEINKTGYVYNVSSGGLRVRKEASTSSTVLGTLYSGNSVNIIGETGSWYKIKYNSSYAYVHKDYITDNKPSSESSNGNNTSNDNNNSSEAMNEIGIVTNVSSNLRVRQKPSSNSLVLGYVLNNEKVNITGKEGNWYKINFKGSTGYVSSDYIRISNGNDNNNGNSGNNGNGESVSNAYNTVLSELKSHIGSPYAYGGSGELVTNSSIQSLKNRFPDYSAAGKYDSLYKYVDSGLRMFDCSGFMQWGFSKANIRIGRTTYDQIKNGVEVSLDSVQPGDLLFYSNLGHVGMYIGNGQWIESPNSGKTIRIVDVPWSSIGRARRVL